VECCDFDEAWVPLMELTVEECKAQVKVPVDSVSISNMDFPLSFIDVAPKAFLQIRHAAGISSREYADILGESLVVLGKRVRLFSFSRFSAGRANVQMDQDQEKALVETLTEGRGGAFFYYSHDRCVMFICPSEISAGGQI
jgi:hypothetical protein